MYRLTDTGFLVYSIGVDGVDNGGRDMHETGESMQYDIRFCIGEPPQPEDGSPLQREQSARESEMRWEEKQRQRQDEQANAVHRGQ